jgi:hypothetical protein
MRKGFQRFGFLTVVIFIALGFFVTSSWAVSVTINKTASTSFKRTYHWQIEKSADQSALTLAPGQQLQVNYGIILSMTGFTDSDWRVTGNIRIFNELGQVVTINSVSDVISGAITANVNCGVTFPYSLQARSALECTYYADLPDGTARTNTATATGGYGSISGSIQGTAPVDFSKATITAVDECVTVSDTYAGSLGAACAGDAPVTFTYSRWIGPYEACGDYPVPNTATFIAPSSATESSNWNVAVNVPCEGGCTLTPGYWKTHSQYGPAPYDNTWAMIGEDAAFFSSGQSYYQVLWTEPKGGNAYYILAHAYIAARLNMLNGASVPDDVQNAFDAASVLFGSNSPNSVGHNKGKGSSDLRATFLGYAVILDEYNNGDTGPGHCSE